jgi:squamous cell carcinoma antigen recognized by T-cells 3
MDENEALQQLEGILNELSESMSDIHVHARHIHLVDSQEALQFQAISAREMLAESLAAPESVWIPILDKRTQSVDMSTPAGVEDLLSLYERAEEDYLCMNPVPIHVLACV